MNSTGHEMMTNSEDYSLYFKFIETFLPTGFNGIDREDPLVQELEGLTESYNQFFYVADAIEMKVHFTSKRSSLMIGISPEELTFYHFMEATHPDDIQRLNLGRSKLVKTGPGSLYCRKRTCYFVNQFQDESSFRRIFRFPYSMLSVLYNNTL